MSDLQASLTDGIASRSQPELLVGLNAVIFAVTRDQPRVLTVGPQSASLGDTSDKFTTTSRALPFGPFNREYDRTLELCMRDTVRKQTGFELGYLEQLYTFADKGRDPREGSGGSRVLSVAYLALLQEGPVAGAEDATWEDCYGFFPWEDWRDGKPALMAEIEEVLLQWSAAEEQRSPGSGTRERIEICFGLGNGGWDAYKVLERYELLYEARLVDEYWLDRGLAG